MDQKNVCAINNHISYLLDHATEYFLIAWLTGRDFCSTGAVELVTGI